MRALASLVAAVCMIGFTTAGASARDAVLRRHQGGSGEDGLLARAHHASRADHRGLGRTDRNARECAAEDDLDGHELQNEVGGARQVPRTRWRQERPAGLGLLRHVPTSWTVMSGAPIKKPAKTPAPATDSGTSAEGSATPPPPTADASKPGAKGPNPCKNLDQAACTAKADTLRVEGREEQMRAKGQSVGARRSR